MAEKRSADVKWTGDLASGSGVVSTKTSEVLKEVSVSWPSRSGAAEGKTSPEELIAAAHAACYAMAFSGRLAKNGTPGTSLDVSCTVTFANVDGGWKIATSEIRFDALTDQTSSAPGSVASGTPTQRTVASIGSNTPAGSHACQSRKGSAMRAAATSTMARTAQLKTRP